MKTVTCDKCGKTMTYAMKDICDTNHLEEVFECQCGNWVAYDEVDESEHHPVRNLSK